MHNEKLSCEGACQTDSTCRHLPPAPLLESDQCNSGGTVFEEAPQTAAVLASKGFMAVADTLLLLLLCAACRTTVCLCPSSKQLLFVGAVVE